MATGIFIYSNIRPTHNGDSFSQPENTSSPSFTWSEPSVTVTLSPGQSQIKDIYLSSGDRVSDLSIEAVPAISGFMTIQPGNIGTINANQPQAVRLGFKIPVQTSLGSYVGTIQVRKSTKTQPQTLKITVNVVFQKYSDAATGISFQYPSLPFETSITKTVISGKETDFDINMKDPSDNEFNPVFGLTVEDSPTGQSLTEWFKSNVDINDAIFNSGAFQVQQLSPNALALVRVGPIPDYGGGPVADIYAITPSGNKVMSIQQSQDSPLLPSYGYSQADKQLLMRRILGTVQIN